VIYIPGNHDYWGEDAKMTDSEERIRLICRDTNIRFLNNGFEIIDGVVFLGTTLWTPLLGQLDKFHIRTWADAVRTPQLNFFKWQELHREAFNFLDRGLKADAFKNLKKVVITHHLPTYKSVPERFIGHELNSFFVADCEELLVEGKGPNLWVHGHTHDSFDYKVNDTRIVCNPYGYWRRGENKQFNPKLIVEV
jgi:predicted phosphohydrolase